MDEAKVGKCQASCDMCTAIVDGFMKQCKRISVTLDAVEEAELSVRCTDDVARCAREEDFTLFRSLGVYEQGDAQN